MRLERERRRKCRGQRNASAMAATIKPSVASQLTAPINSSVMRQCSPCCQRRRLIQGREQKEPVSKKEPRVASGARAWQSI